jgi:hypothetical protein
MQQYTARTTGLGLAVLAVGVCSPAKSEIVVDGKLDEGEWLQAASYSDMKITEPFRLTAPEAGVLTEARMVSTPEGIAVGFVLKQSADHARVKPRLERDQSDPTDAVNFIIDFDGDGRTGYSFAVSMSGSIRDGIVSNESQVNLDWDTEWTWAVKESETGWSVEMLIPWTVASMRGTNTPNRTVGVYFSRTLGSTGERQSFPAIARARGQFMSAFERVEIPQYRSALFHYWPYVTVSHNRNDQHTGTKGGVDLFWKPSAGFQVSATLNPDFGQVESDDLVINFDAVETFFTDKRPFFTENQGIFEVTTPDSGRLVHTRRIGEDADDGSGATDIDGAVKLNGSLGSLSYGVLAAAESGEAGRDFYALRMQVPLGQKLNIGWLGTNTQRPFLERSAQVYAVDMDWKPSNNFIVNATVLGTSTDEAGATTDDTGAFVRMSWTPSRNWYYELEATHFGKQLDFNDLGFQRRASLNELEVTTAYLQRPRNSDSVLSSNRWSVEIQARSNDQGDELPLNLIFGSVASFRNGNAILVFANALSSGVDDLISRGNGNWKMSERYELATQFVSRRYGNWTFGAEFGLDPRGLSAEPAREFAVNATWYPSDSFNVGLEFGPEWTDDWLIWEGGRNFGRYSQRVDFASLELSWFLGLKQELRVKSEFLAIRAEDGERYQLLPSGEMLASGTARPDFDINSFGLQVRYRYFVGPQSDLSLVYSRGGVRRQNRDEVGSGDLLQEAFQLRDADQVLVKIRYRF